MVESSNKPKAINRRTVARGLTQITPIAWKELLKHHRSKYKGLCFRQDIYRPEVAKQAGEDYLYIIQGHLKAKRMPVTLDNVLAAYVWGETNLQKHGMSFMTWQNSLIDRLTCTELILAQLAGT